MDYSYTGMCSARRSRRSCASRISARTRLPPSPQTSSEARRLLRVLQPVKHAGLLHNLYTGHANSQHARTHTQFSAPSPTLRGAGTDARVFIILLGSKGTSGELKLENAPDNFARGKTDKFTFDLQDLGAVDRVTVGHNGVGNCPRWHLDKVHMFALIAGRVCVGCVCVWLCVILGEGCHNASSIPASLAVWT